MAKTLAPYLVLAENPIRAMIDDAMECLASLSATRPDKPAGYYH
jgi:hypothetical protein